MRKIPLIKSVKYKKGDHVVIKGITDPGSKVQDSDLNGRTGILTSKFSNNPHGYIGILLDPINGSVVPERANLFYGEFEHVKK